MTLKNSNVRQSSGREGQFVGYCRSCNSARRIRWFNEHPGHHRKLYLLRAYGMTLSDFEALKTTQGGACAICRNPTTGLLHIDHCHATNRVRGLLCGNCNRAIGLFFDSPKTCRAAAEYLKK